MNKTFFIIFFNACMLYAQFGEDNIFFPKEPEARPAAEEAVKHSVITDSSSLREEFRAALSDPHRYYRNGKHIKLLQSLIGYEQTDISIAPRDSLVRLLIQSQRRRNHIRTIFIHIILFADQRATSKENACESLQKAGKSAFKEVYNPEFALIIQRLGESSQCPGSGEKVQQLKFYLEHDYEIDKLLRINRAAKPDSLLLPIAEKIKKVLPLYPKSSLQKNAMKTIGDIHFRIQNYMEMRKWYKKALEIDPTMSKTTTIGYRMKISDKYYFRIFMTAVIYTVYTLFALLFIIRIIKNRKEFQFSSFIKRTFLFIVGYAVAVSAVFIFDGFRYPAVGSALSKMYYTAPTPIVSLNLFDISFAPTGIIVLGLGFVPILLSLIYISFPRPFSKLIYISGLVLLISSGWTHFFLVTEFDDHLSTDAYFMKERVFLDGEMEQLLADFPDKVPKDIPR